MDIIIKVIKRRRRTYKKIFWHKSNVLVVVGMLVYYSIQTSSCISTRTRDTYNKLCVLYTLLLYCITFLLYVVSRCSNSLFLCMYKCVIYAYIFVSKAGLDLFFFEYYFFF